MGDYDKERTWLQEIVDDRPEGAYRGRFDAGEAAIAKRLLDVLTDLEYWEETHDCAEYLGVDR